MSSFALLTILVGVVEVGPNLCQVDLYHPNKTIHTFQTKCDLIIKEDVVVPYRAPYGP